MSRSSRSQYLLLVALACAPFAFGLPGSQQNVIDVGLGGGALVIPADRPTALQAIRSVPVDRTRHMLVQLERQPDRSARARLERQGIHLLQYIDQRTWFASVSSGAMLPDELADTFTGSWSIRNEDRLAPSLTLAMSAPDALTAGATVDVEILFFGDVDPQLMRCEVSALGGEVQAVIPELEIVTARVPTLSLYALSQVDGIHWIAPHPGAPGPEMDRARAYLNAEDLTSGPYNLTGDGVEVSVHDFGHVFQHTDLGTRWVQGDAGAGQALNVEQHPSMTGGTIAGDGTLNPLFRGFAPGATLVTYSFESDPCCEANNYADIVLALQRGVDVANNSWGYNCEFLSGGLPYGDYSLQARVFDRETLGRDSDGNAIGDPIVVVFSAGNERDGSGGSNSTACIANTTAPFLNYATINQPKPAKNIIVVGAVDSADDRMTIYSSWGPTSDGRLRPDVVAAGHHAGQLLSGVSNINNAFGTPPGSSNQQAYRTTDLTNGGTWGGYAWFSQTSAAAAMVSGGCALLIEDFRSSNGGADPLVSTAKALLIHTARDLSDSTSWYNPGPDFASGYGLVDFEAAVDQLRAGGWLEGCIDQGETRALCLDVPLGTSAVRVTLVWSDEPASPATTSAALVNDLDLVVTDSSGVRHFPWTLDPADPNADAVRTQEDHLNNVEMILVDSAVLEGLWTLEVVGTDVPVGPQCYSLVYTPAEAGGELQLDCPDLIEANAPADKCEVFVAVLASATGGCGDVTVVNNRTPNGPDASDDYPVGDTLVEFTATDAAGNQVTCTTTVRVRDVIPPTIVCPAPLTIECTPDSPQIVADWLDSVTASDACGVVLENDFTGLSDGCGSSGSATVIWKATDPSDNSASCSSQITVLDTVPPELVAPAVLTVECDGAGNLTQLAEWLANASAEDACGNVTLTNDFTGLSGGCGSTGSATVTFRAEDECGNVSTAASRFEIVDTTAPSVSAQVERSVLWPPRNQMVDVGLLVDSFDACQGEELDVMIAVTSDEHPALALGAGGALHCPDAEVTPDGRVLLRAERSGTGNGRVYRITVTAADSCGNVSSTALNVRVPRNLADLIAIDDGQIYDPTICN